MLCALWATLSTVASILACSGFYLPYWIQVREDFPSFSFLTEATGGSRIDDRSIDRSIVARKLIALPPSIDWRTVERWPSFSPPFEIYARGSKSNTHTCLDTTTCRRRLECIVESAILIATRDRSAHISFPTSFAHRAHSLH